MTTEALGRKVTGAAESDIYEIIDEFSEEIKDFTMLQKHTRLALATLALEKRDRITKASCNNLRFCQYFFLMKRVEKMCRNTIEGHFSTNQTFFCPTRSMHTIRVHISDRQ